ncbi:type II toxin-antitoxin system VapC family toxin [Bosea sp. (in: a-proteobacteria)]|uniref:type II toxin-antitoxin system VapC family toxin n=1 Tax=Bosea sp. (in: a-proteobacteria) TaxID=1871050 RepID=UPI002736C363|nr:type II toxin-antitoxin system VapC family toxin [Bosea sp. (in: a-proteobacteria)]MDP3408031.1 type II toxin-antitoxin system VapC family toxin [Bosea sp. (in: a-proteobacteria)]
MKIIADMNVLIRSVVRDDPGQALVAAAILQDASLIVITVPCLCEFAGVLRKIYGFERSVVSAAIRALPAAANVEMNRPAVEAGLSLFDAGSDFADGAICHEGEWLGGEMYVSFDRKAVTLLKAQGRAARLL